MLSDGSRGFYCTSSELWTKCKLYACQQVPLTSFSSDWFQTKTKNYDKNSSWSTWKINDDGFMVFKE